jgi:hypothetical protein
VVHGLAHPPDQVETPLGHRDLEPRLGGQRFEHAHLGGQRLPPVVEPHAAPEPRDRRLGGLAPHLGVVDARHAAPRMQESRRQRAVVGQQEKAGRLEVEPAHRIEPLAHAMEQPRHRRPALRVGERAHHAARLVQHDRPPARRRDGVPVDGDPVALGVGTHAELVHDAPVDADPPGTDERFRRPP